MLKVSEISLDNLVSVVIPCRNEVKYITTFIDSVLNQDLGGLTVEVIIADGMSDDGTRDVLKEYCEKHSEVCLIDNYGKIVSTGLNLAIKKAKGKYIVRMDVHTEYANDYIYQCIQVLEEQGVDNVGGAWCAVGKTYIQKCIAVAFQSSFSSGGANSHSLLKDGLVDSVYLGCWKREAFAKYGLFDEELVRNQDDELNLRINRNGGKVYQSTKIKSWYYPRTSLKGLFKQYMQYGYWKVRVIQKHKVPASIRHIIPAGFIASLFICGFMSYFFKVALYVLIGLIGLYLIINMIAMLLSCKNKEKIRYMPLLPIVFSMYHLGYGYGFLRGVIDFMLFKKVNKSFLKLTR